MTRGRNVITDDDHDRRKLYRNELIRNSAIAKMCQLCQTREMSHAPNHVEFGVCV